MGLIQIPTQITSSDTRITNVSIRGHLMRCLSMAWSLHRVVTVRSRSARTLTYVKPAAAALTIIKYQMPTCRAYELDEKGHVFGPPVIIVASTDADALKQAKHWIDSRDLEIRDEARRVDLVERRRRELWRGGRRHTDERGPGRVTNPRQPPTTSDFGRTQGRRQDDFFREPPARRATKMGSSCASADAVHS